MKEFSDDEDVFSKPQGKKPRVVYSPTKEDADEELRLKVTPKEENLMPTKIEYIDKFES